MKHLFILLWLFYTASYTNAAESNFVELGNSKAQNCWIYLGGLTESFDSPDEKRYRQILDDIGHKLNIRFIALMPRNRCPKFGNKLCWPHQDPAQAAETYQSILPDLKGITINGWIGFSNGGYFLHEILLQKLLTVPIITIGSPGYLDSTDQVYIMIGKEDTYAYKRAKDLEYKIIEYEGGHTINGEALERVLESLYTSPNS